MAKIKSTNSPQTAKKSLKFVHKKQKNLKQILSNLPIKPPNIPSFTNIESPPSILPRKKYCDLTGLEAKYTDPKSRLNYHCSEEYEIIRDLTIDGVQSYLALRNAHVVLK